MTAKKQFARLLVVLIAGWGFQANAQSSHLTPRSLGMSGGGAAYVDGYHANFINPANLMLGDQSITFGIGGFSSSMGGPLANVHVYNTYFTKGLTVTGDIAEEALAQWFGTNPHQMKKFGVKADFIPIGFSVKSKTWAMSMALRSRVMMNTAANKGFAQLGIYGLDVSVFGDGQPVNFSAETFSFYEASLGFSIQVLKIDKLFGFAENVKVYAGVAPKLLLGANAFKMDFNSILTLEGQQNEVSAILHDFNYRFETTGEITNQLTAYYEARVKQGNAPDIDDFVDPQPENFYGIKTAGVGFDIGGTVEMDVHIPVLGAFFRGAEHLQVALSVTDLGSLTFTEQAGVFTADDKLAWRGFDFNEDEIDKKYNGDRDEYISHVLEDSIMTGIYNSFSPNDDAALERRLPTMLHFGSQLTLNKLSISVGLSQGFNTHGINSRRTAISTGLEYDLFGFLPLRVGMRTGGYTSTSYSAGLGLEFDNFELSVAAAAVDDSSNNGTHVAGAWSGLVFKF